MMFLLHFIFTMNRMCPTTVVYYNIRTDECLRTNPRVMFSCVDNFDGAIALSAHARDRYLCNNLTKIPEARVLVPGRIPQVG